MYAQSFFVTSVRGIGLDPITGASCALGVIGFMNAGLGFRLAPPARFLRPDFFAPLFRPAFFREELFFLAPPFFLVAIEVSPAGGMEGVVVVVQVRRPLK